MSVSCETNEVGLCIIGRNAKECGATENIEVVGWV